MEPTSQPSTFLPSVSRNRYRNGQDHIELSESDSDHQVHRCDLVASQLEGQGYDPLKYEGQSQGHPFQISRLRGQNQYQDQNQQPRSLVISNYGSTHNEDATLTNLTETNSLHRLQCRLMTSVFVTLVFYILGLMSIVPMQSQYLFMRIAEDKYNLSNLSASQVSMNFFL